MHSSKNQTTIHQTRACYIPRHRICPALPRAHNLQAKRRGCGEARHPASRRSRPHRHRSFKIIPASLLHIAGGYSPLSSTRLHTRRLWVPGAHEHFDIMALKFMLDANICCFRYGRPSSRKPYALLGHVNRRQPGCDKRASVRRSLQEMLPGGCSRDPLPPRSDCHRRIMTASFKCRTA